MSKHIAVSNRRRKLKSLAIKFLGGRCARCGFNEHQSALVPHHVNPDKKSFSIGATGCTKKWIDIQDECRKCILLCLNCHSIVHTTNEEFWFDESNIPSYENIEDEKITRIKSIFLCVDCGKRISYHCKRCVQCSNKNKSKSQKKRQIKAGRNPPKPRPTKVDWPSKDELCQMVESSNYSAVGRILGVSDNAVRKHLKKS